MRQRGKQKGSSVLELGPALIVLFLIFMFPLVDFLAVAVSYGLGWYLNFMEVREAALTMVVRSDAVINGSDVEKAVLAVRDRWLSSGFGQFTRAKDVSQSIELSQTPPNGPLRYVRVTTNVTVEPFLKVPFIVPVPGLTTTLPFNYVSERPVEDVG